MGNRDIIRTENVLVRIMELEGGSATEWHHHSEVADFFVCLTGAVQVETKGPDAKVLLHPGERTEVTAPRIHRVLNLESECSAYLLVQGVGAYDFVREQL